MELLKQSTKSVCKTLCFALMLTGMILTVTSCKTAISDQYIDIDERSPWYWNYKGKTVLLPALYGVQLMSVSEHKFLLTYTSQKHSQTPIPFSLAPYKLWPVI
ncbi:MAG: hypothetical protein R6U58_13180 [Bacteroidales bacterium]